MGSGQTDSAARNVGVETTEGIGVQELGVAALSGLAGIVAMVPLLVIAWSLGALDPASFAALATIIGFGESFVVGGLLFVAGGVVTFPLLFVALAVFLPGESLTQKGAGFGIIVWTGFLIAFYTAQTGANLPVYVVVTFFAHVVYGAVLGGVYGRYANVPYYEV